MSALPWMARNEARAPAGQVEGAVAGGDRDDGREAVGQRAGHAGGEPGAVGDAGDRDPLRVEAAARQRAVEQVGDRVDVGRALRAVERPEAVVGGGVEDREARARRRRAHAEAIGAVAVAAGHHDDDQRRRTGPRAGRHAQHAAVDVAACPPRAGRRRRVGRPRRAGGFAPPQPATARTAAATITRWRSTCAAAYRRPRRGARC